MFVHLHGHSEFSVLDGASKIKELVSRAVELGQPALAVTDHGSMSGIYELYRECVKQGIKPIIGCEFYIESPIDGKNNHLVVLAKNEKGMENMFLMLEFANFENFNRRPRITYEELFRRKEGLVVTSACLAGTISRYYMAGDTIASIDLARKMKEEFGEDFYLEIQPNSIPEQESFNKWVVGVAKMLGIKLIACADFHYTLKEHAFAHEVLLAMQMKKKMKDDSRYKFSVPEFYLKSEDEMREGLSYLPTSVIEESLLSTIEVMDKCNVTIKRTLHHPKYYNIPEGKTARTLLAERINDGVKKLGYENNWDDLQYELDVIDRNGYSDYFLIVQDYINSAKARGELVSPGRGSGCGSKVVYATGMSDVDPEKYNLLFERFLVDGREPDYCIVA